MKFHSELPEVVGQLDLNWEGLPADFSYLGRAKLLGPVSVEEISITRRERSDSSHFALEAYYERRVHDILRQVVDCADRDYRSVHDIGDNQQINHWLGIRRGRGTSVSLRDLMLYDLGHGENNRKLRKSTVHTDGPERTDRDEVAYTITTGAGTIFWEGSFRAPRLPFGWLSYALQVKKYSPGFISRDGEVLRFDPRTTVHQGPASLHNPENPRTFIRDIVTVVDVES